jgi:hypothetical protein
VPGPELDTDLVVTETETETESGAGKCGEGAMGILPRRAALRARARGRGGIMGSEHGAGDRVMMFPRNPEDIFGVDPPTSQAGAESQAHGADTVVTVAMKEVV